MKYLLILLLYPLIGISQNKTYTIIYEQQITTDTLKRNEKTFENFRLLSTEKISVYKSVDAEKFDSLFNKEIEKNKGNFEQNKEVKFDLSGVKNGSRLKFYTEIDKNIVIKHEKFRNLDYLVQDDSKINWKIADESKYILELKCQKAFCNFKGRDYIVWFTSQIPIGIGPWKLRGLPGAILYAEDLLKDYVFTATKFTAKSTQEQVLIPTNSSYVTKKELDQLKEAPLMDNNDGLSIKLSTKNGIIKKKVKTNNPIELTE